VPARFSSRLTQSNSSLTSTFSPNSLDILFTHVSSQTAGALTTFGGLGGAWPRFSQAPTPATASTPIAPLAGRSPHFRKRFPGWRWASPRAISILSLRAVSSGNSCGRETKVRATLSPCILIETRNLILPKAKSESQTRLSEGRELAFGSPATQPWKGQTTSAQGQAQRDPGDWCTSRTRRPSWAR
jgi:hypothetical protein